MSLLLSADAVRKRFGRRQVLNGVSVDVRAGEIVGICGENGAGKSTLVQILAGVTRADAGGVRRAGVIGYAPQTPLLYDQLTVWEHFAYFGAARRLAPRMWTARAHSLLETYRFAQWQHDRVVNLSGGTRQKLNLALALLADPTVLLLDEPYGGFEWETYLRFWDQARELAATGRSLVIVSHLFFDRSQLDRIVELQNGTVV